MKIIEMKNLIFIVSFLAFNTLADPLLIDFKSIAGKSLEQVEPIVGKPSKCNRPYVENVLHCVFKAGAIEIFFVNDVSDWITISTFEKYPYAIESISHIGLTSLPNSKPTAKLGWLTHYEPYLNYKSIMLGEGENGLLAYISIKVNTLNFGVFTPLPNSDSSSKIEVPKELNDLDSEIQKLQSKLR
ncbi:hypothetical protein D0C16_19260 [Cellvibrio sp. KY-GH-1]|uniref:hypothetical protein n=1 Tax=Cellvibrio sp. KY-GH-1 TaxID=2303332 RepID=UPI001247CB0E|nr:hypothetical protein [Cellvibrio sp. KY-GH-1]QEY17940.1 hypothetical protein D0C16_19260 [Cellvibrio sp. KY-GH-1]